MTTRNRTTGIGRGWIAVLALALAMRLLMPAGWMPATNGLGFVMCGDGPSLSIAEIARQRGDGAPLVVAIGPAAMPKAEGKGDPPSAPQPDHPCAFAGATAALTGPVQVSLATSLQPQPTPTTPRLRDVVVGRGLPAPPPPATGPPATA